ncbi:hypothetical protein L3X38_033557 [Prunus dulcis]|uniref:Uncharacterized protein n=1 Tax=Prunus dulcis TaxID=3755 RepID=A0AAD4VHK6_PRUDU|nr:hypothetical protein L3X38_033557 [Prunus dulcis]
MGWVFELGDPINFRLLQLSNLDISFTFELQLFKQTASSVHPLRSFSQQFVNEVKCKNFGLNIARQDLKEGRIWSFSASV